VFDQVTTEGVVSSANSRNRTSSVSIMRFLPRMHGYTHHEGGRWAKAYPASSPAGMMNCSYREMWEAFVATRHPAGEETGIEQRMGRLSQWATINAVRLAQKGELNALCAVFLR